LYLKHVWHQVVWALAPQRFDLSVVTRGMMGQLAHHTQKAPRFLGFLGLHFLDQ
jgi:hypothetical protein